MHYRQKGWKVNISRLVGYIFLIPSLSCLVLFFVSMWVLLSEKNDFNVIAMAILFYAALIFGMAVFAAYNLWKYPTFSTSGQGIELKTFFYTLKIEWKNIIQMQRINNRLIIFLQRKGLFFNRLYGLFDAKAWDQPIVLFDSDDEVIKQLENEIRALTGNK